MYFTDRNLKVGFKINLDSHHINHANSKLTIMPNYPEFAIEVRYIIKIIKELSVTYVRLTNQYNFIYQLIFSARFDKQDKDNQGLDETEIFSSLNINHNLTESDIDKIAVKSPLEQQIQQQEMKDSGWRFDEINSMTVYFYKTGELDGGPYVKNPLRSNAILNIENIGKNCLMRSTLAILHPCNNNHPNRVSNYKQFFDELNINGFDFSKGFKCSVIHKFDKMNNLSIDTFELNFYQDQSKWRHELIPIEASKN